MASEVNYAAVWIYKHLASSQVLTTFVGKHPKEDVWQIYEGIAPEDANLPLCLFRFLGDKVKSYTDGRTGLVMLQYSVNLYEDATTFSNMAPIVDEISKALCLEDPDFVIDSRVQGVRKLANVQGQSPQDGIGKLHMGYKIEVCVDPY